MSVPGVLVTAISKDLGWSIGDISSLMALRLFLFGGIAPFAGAFLVRYGLRNMMAISASLVVVGLLVSSIMTKHWQLWVGVGVLLGVAPGLTAIAVNTTVATRWFSKQRGLVLGILGAANATGRTASIPPSERGELPQLNIA